MTVPFGILAAKQLRTPSWLRRQPSFRNTDGKKGTTRPLYNNTAAPMPMAIAIPTQWLFKKA
jgi:hypothetical protein